MIRFSFKHYFRFNLYREVTQVVEQTMVDLADQADMFVIVMFDNQRRIYFPPAYVPVRSIDNWLLETMDAWTRDYRLAASELETVESQRLKQDLVDGRYQLFKTMIFNSVTGEHSPVLKELLATSAEIEFND